MAESSYSSSFLMMMIPSIFLAAINPAILALRSHNKILHRLFKSIIFSILLCPLNLIYYSFQPSKSTTTAPRNNGQKRRGGGGVKTTLSGGGDDQSSTVADSSSIPAVSRALNQLLSTLNDIPVSSRKYEMVRSLAEKLIEENRSDGLNNQLNSRPLSSAFSNTLRRLEQLTAAASVDTNSERGIRSGLRRIIIMTRSAGLGGRSWLMTGRFVRRVGKSVRDLAMSSLPKAGVVGDDDDGIDKEAQAEKLAAELLWLAEKWVACGGALDAVDKWGSASRLARISLFAWPRLQGGLVKVTAFLIKQAKDLQITTDTEKSSTTSSNKYEDQHKQQKLPQLHLDNIKLKMLVCWLPLLCRGINGTDKPILSTGERGELEAGLQQMIESLEQDVDKERVLSTWLHHFVHCASSDWPNLYGYYLRWCSDSRKEYITSCK